MGINWYSLGRIDDNLEHPSSVDMILVFDCLILEGLDMNFGQIIGLVILGIVVLAMANRNKIGFANQPGRKTTKTPPIECEVCGTVFDSLPEYLGHKCQEKT